jgi:hypothetical protein
MTASTAGQQDTAARPFPGRASFFAGRKTGEGRNFPLLFIVCFDSIPYV